MNSRGLVVSLSGLLLLSPLAFADSSDTCNGINVYCTGNVVNNTSKSAAFNASESVMTNGTLTYQIKSNQQNLTSQASNIFTFYSTNGTSANVGTVTMAYDIATSPVTTCKFTYTFSSTGNNQAYISKASGSCGNSTSFTATCQQPTAQVACYISQLK